MDNQTGQVMLDVLGTELTEEEKDILTHPLVGGVIFFARNYETPSQIIDLIKNIREIRPELLLAVDQEGGRVQRFKQGFLPLPAMGLIGNLFQKSKEQALSLAYTQAWLMASELLSVGIDFSFAPVLDLNKSKNTVIGDRSYSADSGALILLATEQVEGMHSAGMAATGKHFPGHGDVTVDSHLALPIDERQFERIYAEDLQPFLTLIQSGLDAMMPAHILFPEVDDKPVGFSSHWLQTILKKGCHFKGVIFSDDLNMEGSSSIGSYAERAKQAIHAGCDMVLICNNRPAAIQILDQLPNEQFQIPLSKLQKMKGKFSVSHSTLRNSSTWNKHYQTFASIQETL